MSQKYLTTKEHKGFHEGTLRYLFENQTLCAPWCFTSHAFVVKYKAL
jgi:hypothetical protein